jgi:hypothetical protein
VSVLTAISHGRCLRSLMLRMLNLGLCVWIFIKKRNSINLSMDSGHRVQPFVTDTFVTVAPLRLVCRGRLGTGAAARRRVINKNPDRQTTLNTSNIIS